MLASAKCGNEDEAYAKADDFGQTSQLDAIWNAWMLETLHARP